jgi:hypothetical protein
MIRLKLYFKSVRLFHSAVEKIVDKRMAGSDLEESQGSRPALEPGAITP